MDNYYYISQGNTPEEHLSYIEKVVKAGIGLVQLRMKGFSEEIYLSTAIKAKKICETGGATLIINDSIKVALQSNANGVHLGKLDNPPSEAKQILSKNMLVGGTANTIEDCLYHIQQGVDYIGLGPFRFTTTKKNLSPILGIEGYQKIMDALKENGHSIPVYAIGGITEKDISPLLNTGVSGIAASTLLSKKSPIELKELIHGTTKDC